MGRSLFLGLAVPGTAVSAKIFAGAKICIAKKRASKVLSFL
jgi:hypothetical protein